MPEMKDRWLSVGEIGEYLGVSSDTVYRWISTRSMPAHRMGRFWKFKKDEVDAWVRLEGLLKKKINRMSRMRGNYARASLF